MKTKDEIVDALIAQRRQQARGGVLKEWLTMDQVRDRADELLVKHLLGEELSWDEKRILDLPIGLIPSIPFSYYIK